MTPHPESRKLVKITFLVITFFEQFTVIFFAEHLPKNAPKNGPKFYAFFGFDLFFFGLFLTFFLLNNSWILSYFISVLKKVCFVFFVEDELA